MQDIRDHTRPELRHIIISLGEKPAHATRLFNCLYRDNAASWAQVTGLPQNLRARLAREYSIAPYAWPAHTLVSRLDGTVKLLFRFEDGATAESVVLYGGGRRTACLSSQSGCACGCSFCATGALGLKRNLAPREILAQFEACLSAAPGRLDSIVFMGMGEPFLNWPNVKTAILNLSDSAGRYFPQSRISVSTVGIVPGITALAESDLKINLAISVITADETQRAELVPMQAEYPLSEVIASAKDYCARRNKKVFLEYILFAGINDTPACALELAALAKTLPCTVNLIRYNSSAGRQFCPATPESTKRFHEILRGNGIRVYERAEQGADINAACGQLAAGKNASPKP
ncbi:MAG: 23S rRNA (adenine(2503)-C(2))-methyltransferase RlmN [Elusimicrobiaceae bacterium]|nr:23S rRNA (adenine(2503)-C(2))-methyltransferase RlmN [Elusimicrobiaceae bacterium]